MRSILIILALLGLFFFRDHTPAGADGLFSPKAPDSTTLYCPAGPTTTTFMVFLRCGRSVVDQLFAHDAWTRVVPEPPAPRGFTAFTARTAIARSAAVPIRALDVAIGGVSFSNGPSGEFRTDSEGNGFAFWVSKADSGTRLALCQLRGGVSSNPVVHTVTAHDVLLVKLTLDGRDCVGVMHALTPELAATSENIRSGRSSRERNAFNASLAALIRAPLQMRAGDPPPAIKTVLQHAE